MIDHRHRRTISCATTTVIGALATMPVNYHVLSPTLTIAAASIAFTLGIVTWRFIGRFAPSSKIGAAMVSLLVGLCLGIAASRAVLLLVLYGACLLGKACI